MSVSGDAAEPEVFLTNQKADPTATATAPAAPGDVLALDRYRQIYEAVALPVLLIDAESWKIVAVNEAAVELYGYTREEFVGLSVLVVRPPDGQAEARRVLAEAPHGYWKASAVRHARKDGSEFRADVWSRDTFIDGRPVRVSTISDVTERVRLQHELQQAQKMEAVGRLAGGIAHDFNNALTSIIGGAELLAESVRGNEAALTDIQEIRRAADRAASLTRQLLAFSRQQVMRVELLSLNALVRKAEGLLRHIIGEHIALRTELDPAEWQVRADASQLEQVIMNLAVNARDAMPGGGELVVSTRRTAFTEETAVHGAVIPAGEYAELIVRDTGTGMDDLTRSRVFEPFFTTKPAPEGTGLGLSMAYGIIRQSNGYITVESAVGEGAAFHILLPRAGPAAAEAPVHAAPAESGTAPTVLVVEDEDAVRRITCRVLERLGYRVLAAANGEEALALLEAERPVLDLLLTDLIMPRMSGRELASELVQAQPKLRVLFVSGYTDEAVGHLGMLEEGMGFLQKPFSLESLGEAVRKVMGDD
jgi:PAS domain S-box-containing protein